MWKSLVAMTGKSNTEIPVGEIVQAPARIPEEGIVKVRWVGRKLKVLALDLFDSATLVMGDGE